MTFYPTDTSSGNVTIELPRGAECEPLGSERLYLKTTPDVYGVTILNSTGGQVVLWEQGQTARFVSDGKNWWTLSRIV